MKESQNGSSFSFLILDPMITLTDSNLKITLLILPHTNTAMDGGMMFVEMMCFCSRVSKKYSFHSRFGHRVVSFMRKQINEKIIFLFGHQNEKNLKSLSLNSIFYCFIAILSASSSHDHHKYSYIERKIRRENNPAEPCR